MQIEYDPAKRDLVLRDRQLDIGEAARLFDGFHLTRRDDQHSDVEDRFISVGAIEDDIVIVVWTERHGARRIITMWKANEKERRAYRRQFEKRR